MKSRLYRVWDAMKQRCTNPNNNRYKNYGARGITICKEWYFNSKSFIDWALQNGYHKDLQIDRIDNNGNYEPNNCRFVTRKENARNRITAKLTLYQVEQIRYKYSLGNTSYRKLGEEFGVSHVMINDIIHFKNWR